MEMTIHDVNKIEFDPIDDSHMKDESSNYTIRKLRIESSRGEKLEISCFGKTKEDLEVEVERIEKV